MSLDPTDPALLFGGTWQQITGRFLLAAGGGYSAGTTGGEATHKLTVAEMPSHSHGVGYYHTMGGGGGGLNVIHNAGTYYSTNSVGGSQPHNNIPPYLAVYMWQRMA